ncbi:pilS cassette, partial [Neisseria gonorrhoeae]
MNFCCFLFLDSHFRGNDGSVATVTVRFRLCWNFGKLMNRHSRAGGNLVCSVSVISD